MIPLSTIWDDLCIWLGARVADPFPATRVAFGERVSAHQPDEPYPFVAREVEHADALWRRFHATRDYSVLNDVVLSYVLEGVGFLLGEQLGLSFPNATHFGAWLAQAITDISGDHDNDYVIAACEAIAGGTVYGEREQRACGAYGPEFWQRYPDGVRAVVEFLRA